MPSSYSMICRAIDSHQSDMQGVEPQEIQALAQSWANTSSDKLIHALQPNAIKQRFEHSQGRFANQNPFKLTCITQQSYKQQKQYNEIQYGTATTTFGDAFIACLNKDICKLAFFDNEQQKQLLEAELKSQWPDNPIKHNQGIAEQRMKQVFAGTEQDISLLAKGTPFQAHVWQALLNIAQGELVSYSDIAAHIGKPKAVRAAATAIANNPIAWLIPCHRVIRSNGDLNQYRWGAKRKHAMIGWEIAQNN